MHTRGSRWLRQEAMNSADCRNHSVQHLQFRQVTHLQTRNQLVAAQHTSCVNAMRCGYMLP